MASSLPFFGEPLPKRRRPEVPKFTFSGAPGGLSEAEYERRNKAGVLDPATPMPGTEGSLASAPAPVQAQAAAAPHAAEAPCAVPATADHAVSVTTGGAPGAGTGGPAAASTKPAPTPRTPDHVGSPGASPAPADPEPINESDAEGLGSEGGNVGQKYVAGVYGLGARHAVQAREATRKAIALRLEPLREGLPSFERVLTEGQQSVVIGSKRGGCDLVVVDEAVSKKHCVLTLIGIKGELALSIVDHSTNGTFVNGKRLPAKGKRFRIRSGATVQIKDLSLEDDLGWKCDFGNTVSFFQRA